MKHHNQGLTKTDEANIALIMAMHPYPQTVTLAIRQALANEVHNADPVQLEAARKQVRKAGKK